MADPTINDLDPAVVAQNEAFLVTFIQEQYPSLDLSEGRVLRNLLIRPAAQYYALNNINIDLVRQSMSLIAIEANPLLADPTLVDAVLSNYRLTRDPGVKATGQITIVIQNLLTTPVAQGTVFTANGMDYVTTQAFVGVTTQAAVATTQQRLIVRRNDGLFAFTVPVIAAAVGQAYNAKRATRFVAAPPPAGIVDAFATADFIGGSNAQTNQDMIALFKLALSPQVFSGRANIASLLVNRFPNVVASSIIGFGDEEMIRDRHNIFAISTGGKADLYVKTAAVPVSLNLAKTATLIDAVNGVWQFALLRDDAPGFYTVDAVLPPNTDPSVGAFTITSEVRGLDLSQDTDEFVPDVVGLVEGAYSRYQTAVVQFIDPAGVGGTVGQTASYVVFVTAMPNIKDIQNLAVSRGSRNPQADYLVRAPIPAFAQVSLTVLYSDGTPLPDVNTIKTAVANRVNGLNFILGRLPGAVIYQAVQDVIASTGAMVEAPIDITVVLRKPSGDQLRVRVTDEVVVPDLPLEAVTSRTTIFYMGLRDVDVTIQKVPVLPV
jgi:hypothetical protein